MSGKGERAQRAFTRACDEFWNALLRCHSSLLQRRFWAAREDFHAIVLHNLMVLLRLESGAPDSRQTANPAAGIETAISQERVARLRACIPSADDHDIERAMRSAAGLAEEVCRQVHQDSGWDWPEALAAQMRVLLQPGLVELADLPPVVMKAIGIVENEVNELLPPKEIKRHPSRIVVDPALVEGLDGLSGGQRLLVVFHFHRLSGYELRQHPKNNPALPKRGVFALHSPLRPNPIGVTEVDLLRRESNVLHVRGLDAVNGTPVLDLKQNSQLLHRK